MLVVDDGSPDGTAKLVLDRAADEPRIHLMERSGKQGRLPGQGSPGAWSAATTPWSRWTPTCPIPGRLPALLDGLAAADLVIGSRYVPGGRTVNWSRLREAISHGGNAYVRLALGMPVHDCTAGYRAYRREVLEALPVASGAVQRLLLPDRDGPQDLAGGVPGGGGADHFTERGLGVSKMSKQIVAEALLGRPVGLTGGRKRAERPHPRSVAAAAGGRPGR